MFSWIRVLQRISSSLKKEKKRKKKINCLSIRPLRPSLPRNSSLNPGLGWLNRFIMARLRFCAGFCLLGVGERVKTGRGECWASKMGLNNQKKQWKGKQGKAFYNYSLKLPQDIVMAEKIISDSVFSFSYILSAFKMNKIRAVITLNFEMLQLTTRTWPHYW